MVALRWTTCGSWQFCIHAFLLFWFGSSPEEVPKHIHTHYIFENFVHCSFYGVCSTVLYTTEFRICIINFGYLGWGLSFKGGARLVCGYK